jgi:hypothetical protein
MFENRDSLLNSSVRTDFTSNVGSAELDLPESYAGMNEEKVGALKVGILDTSEEVKKLINQVEAIKLNVQNNLDGESRDVVINKIDSVITQLNNFNNNVMYYFNGIGRALSVKKEEDEEIGSTVTGDAENVY